MFALEIYNEIFKYCDLQSLSNLRLTATMFIQLIDNKNFKIFYENKLIKYNVFKNDKILLKFIVDQVDQLKCF